MTKTKRRQILELLEEIYCQIDETNALLKEEALEDALDKIEEIEEIIEKA